MFDNTPKAFSPVLFQNLHSLPISASVASGIGLMISVLLCQLIVKISEMSYQASFLFDIHQISLDV